MMFIEVETVRVSTLIPVWRLHPFRQVGSYPPLAWLS